MGALLMVRELEQWGLKYCYLTETPGSANWRKSCMHQNCPTTYSVSLKLQKQVISQISVELAVKSWERLWHRRYGQVGLQNLQKLTKNEMIEQFDYDSKKWIRFCESCVSGKIHHNPFKPSRRHTTESLELVYSDVCGKMDEKSQGGAEYFPLLTTTYAMPGSTLSKRRTRCSSVLSSWSTHWERNLSQAKRN